MTIRRSRLEQWLASYAQYPARFVAAPAGSGKTSLLLTYAAASETQVAYCSLPERCLPGQLRAAVASALGLSRTPASYAALVQAVSGSPARCIELIIDDADNACAEAIVDVLRLIEDVGPNVALIYAGRSRERLGVRRLIARGIAVCCDARLLAFDAQEAELFAQACGAECSELDARRLVEQTDGWAIALCGALRTAAAEREPPMRAYRRWRAQSSAFVDEFVDAELERVGDEERRAFAELLGGKVHLERTQLRRLQSCGLFIYDDGSEMLRPYRVLRAETPPAAPVAQAAHTPPMMVRMFRSFEARIDGREIPWVRRRDQQIVKYLLLKPDGKASRAELASVFWGDTERHLATQSVRTACSTIRRAIANVVGPNAVDTYFRTAPDVQIDLSSTACDVRRFLAHTADADAAYARGDMESAAMHYRAAEKLYSGPLLGFESPEPFFQIQARLLQERCLVALERLAQIALDEGKQAEAREYAFRARAIDPELPSPLRLTGARA